MQNGCVLFARWQNVSTLRSASSSAQVSQESHAHGPVVRQVVWSPWRVVQWSPQCCGSCRPVAPHESHSRAGFGLHSTWDRTRGLMLCLVKESESQDPSQDGISVFSLNSRVLPWGKGRRTESIAQCMSGFARSLVSVCQNGSEWLCQSCRIVAGSAVLLAVLVPGRFPNSQFCPSTDPVLFNCVPARF